MRRAIAKNGSVRHRPEAGAAESRSGVSARVELHVPLATIVKVLLTALLVWAVLQLVPQLLLFVLTLLVAITLFPVVAFLERLGLSRGLSVAAVGLAIEGRNTELVVGERWSVMGRLVPTTHHLG